MKCKLAILSTAMLLLGFSSGAAAQSSPTTIQPAPLAPATAPAVPPAADSSGKLVLKEGGDVKLKFAQDLSSKTANDDDPVNLVLDEDLKVGEVTVCKAGAKAVGTVTHAKKAG